MVQPVSSSPEPSPAVEPTSQGALAQDIQSTGYSTVDQLPKEVKDLIAYAIAEKLRRDEEAHNRRMKELLRKKG